MERKNSVNSIIAQFTYNNNNNNDDNNDKNNNNNNNKYNTVAILCIHNLNFIKKKNTSVILISDYTYLIPPTI